MQQKQVTLWADLVSGLPAHPAPGRGRLDLTLAGAHHRGIEVAFAPWGAFRVAEPAAGQLVVGSLCRPDIDQAGVPPRPDRPAYGALEFVHDLLRPAGLGAVLDLTGAVAVERGGPGPQRALDVGLPGGPARIRLSLDPSAALLPAGTFLPDPDELSWQLTGWTPCPDPDPALFTPPGGDPRAAADWVLAPGEPG